MTQLCPLCKMPILVAQMAIGDISVALSPEPISGTTVGQIVGVVVGGFVWKVDDVVAAIDSETGMGSAGSYLYATTVLDWHLVHVCMAVPA